MAASYSELIEKVRVIDTDAADYLETEARKLESFDIGHNAGCLQSVFVWSDTPHTHEYWSDINAKLK